MSSEHSAVCEKAECSAARAERDEARAQADRAKARERERERDMTVEPYAVTLWTKEDSDKLKAAWSGALRNGLDALEKMVEQHESACRERDEATIKLKFIETEYEKTNASELTRDALALQNAALVARCETLRELADSAAAEQGLANRRMTEAQAARDQLREELARLHRLAPTGTYTVSLPHEQEIQRLSGEKYTWQARAELAEEAANGLREALRAAEKRELEALAELDEARAALQRVVEYDSDPDQSWSDLMSWCRGALLPREEREARCKYLVKS